MDPILGSLTEFTPAAWAATKYWQPRVSVLLQTWHQAVVSLTPTGCAGPRYKLCAGTKDGRKQAYRKGLNEGGHRNVSGAHELVFGEGCLLGAVLELKSNRRFSSISRGAHFKCNGGSIVHYN